MFRGRSKRVFAQITGPCVGIELGDNDFHYTQRAFFRLFIDSALGANPEALTKANIVALWNETASGIYWLVQNGYTYSTVLENGKPVRSAKHDESIRRYLQIDESRVYIGQECIDYITNDTGKLNGSFCYVDIGQGEVFTA